MVFKGAGRRGFIKICRISVKVITLKGYVRSGSPCLERGFRFIPGFLREARKGSRGSFWLADVIKEQTTRSKIRVARERYYIFEGWKAGDKGLSRSRRSLEVERGRKGIPSILGRRRERDENTDFNGEYSNYRRIYSIWLLSARVYSSNRDLMSRLSFDLYWGYRSTPFDRCHSLLYLESNGHKDLELLTGESSRARW